MKQFIYIIAIFVVSLGWAQERTARISVYSQPIGVQIRLDSLLIGKTPIKDYEVEPGEHQLEALSPYNGIWNISNLIKTFRIKSGQDTTLRFHFAHQIQINSVPYHASLMYNNKQIGLTPLTIPFEENRDKTFSLEKKGYHSIQFVLREPRSQFFVLQPLNIQPEKEEKQSFFYSLFHTRIRSKTLLLTGTVLTHWLAFHFKNLADDNFDKYSSTSDPRLMNKYWDNTQKYDRYSEITLGISYALLGGLIYTVVKH
ncbi:MAG: hypothetical protein Kow0042_14260 [Calditrichia bacterium]